MLRTKVGSTGFTLIEVVIGVGLIVMLFGGIYLVYYSVLDVIENTERRSAAAAILNREIEIIRNMPYGEVGTIGGIPAGILPQTKVVTSTTGSLFSLTTVIRNIDDLFDGTLGGAPNDTAPADYKAVELELVCTNCPSFVPMTLALRAAPKDLESASQDGSLFVNVLNASGEPVSNATVRVVNASTSPTIDLTDTTNAAGVLQLVGVPTGTQNYQITVSKAGYSREQTYWPGEPSNPNPVNPHLTVAAQTLTQTSYLIDATSALEVETTNAACSAIGGEPFSLTGSKLIGTSPDVVKYIATSTTNANGTAFFDGVEWDTYAPAYIGSYDLVGTIPLAPLTINPATATAFRFVLLPASPNSLMVTVQDAASSAPLPDSAATLEAPGFLETLMTGRARSGDTTWAGSAFTSESGMDTEGAPGSVTMLAEGGVYSTSTVATLVSRTLDFGSTSTTYFTMTWNPIAQPPQTGALSARFQLAATNDVSSWNFVGPDGTAATYFETSGSAVGVVANGNRYLRYMLYMTTADENATPQIDDVAFEFTGPCVPSGQTLFGNLALGSYNLTVNAPGYSEATSSVTVGSGWQETKLLVVP